jgi:hypothetical protein
VAFIIIIIIIIFKKKSEIPNGYYEGKKSEKKIDKAFSN